MSRRPFVAGNWKMHKTAAEAADFVRAPGGVTCRRASTSRCARRTRRWPRRRAPHRGLRIAVYAQNMHQAASGAFTGEVSAEMILDTGADGVLLGHSERRQLFGETDEGVNAKLAAAHDAGLWAIVRGRRDRGRARGGRDRAGAARARSRARSRGIGAERVRRDDDRVRAGLGDRHRPHGDAGRWRRRRTPRSAPIVAELHGDDVAEASGSSTAAR